MLLCLKPAARRRGLPRFRRFPQKYGWDSFAPGSRLFARGRRAASFAAVFLPLCSLAFVLAFSSDPTYAEEGRPPSPIIEAAASALPFVSSASKKADTSPPLLSAVEAAPPEAPATEPEPAEPPPETAPPEAPSAIIKAGARYELSEYERRVTEQVVMAESGGEPYAGQVAVAQCILNTCEKEGIRPDAAVVAYRYTKARPEPTPSVRDAVSAVFDRGEGVTEGKILYFYNPSMVRSVWHESQAFVIEINAHRFFAAK